jgi:DNA-directed RNA polymerase specialized sigma24 family protein
MGRLRGDETDLFERHHARLRYHVATYTGATDDFVDEACSFAWVQLLRRHPDRESVAGWLWRVAVRETHRLQGVERRQQALHEDRSEARDVIGPRHRWVEALEALSALRISGGCSACGQAGVTITRSRRHGRHVPHLGRQLRGARKRLAAVTE